MEVDMLFSSAGGDDDEMLKLPIVAMSRERRSPY